MSTSSASAFESLHPAIQHHVVNTLGWRRLRPLQEASIVPILKGEHVILLAPTAGGKTEAAFFPVLSRMLTEPWTGLSTLYVCPIKALLNNLEPRLGGYAGWTGRRVALWHGDVGAGARRKILRDPPDVLLTTPESIEVMLTSVRTDHRSLFANLRAVVVDEMHAFAGDDRGWHLLAVLERLQRLAGRDLQRVGLSATIGNAEEMLAWLAGSSRAPRRVVSPAVETSVETDVQLDYVGSLDNAARVISRLHRGEKRLVFCDSRARVESLAATLRASGVNTFVSHSSLSLDERRRAEEAFAAGRDAVIVATSTLELGIDVGDLDRVIQIDAPSTVASFLQRLGRTGRRPDTVRNCLFLATGETPFLQAAGVLQLWSEGYVEPVVAPPKPFHILAQQILGLILQERGVGRRTWRDWLAEMPAFARMGEAQADNIVDYMLSREILFEDSGILSFGSEGERSFGFRNFLEVVTVFTSDPLFAVRHGREELGFVHPTSFAIRKGNQRPVLLLAGRSWAVIRTDYSQRIAWVRPSEEKGRSQWLGTGQPLHFDLCRAVRRVLSRGELPVRLTSRGERVLASLLESCSWVDEQTTAVVRAGGRFHWWTFAGLAANCALAEGLGPLQKQGARGQNLVIALDADAAASDVERRIRDLRADGSDLSLPVSEEALEGLKFHSCLPPKLAKEVVTTRLSDPEGLRACLAEDVRFVNVGD